MKKLTLASVTITLSLILVGCNSDTSEGSNNTQSDNTDNQAKTEEKNKDDAAIEESKNNEVTNDDKTEASREDNTKNNTNKNESEEKQTKNNKESYLADFSSKEIEYARIWEQLGPMKNNMKGMDTLYVKEIPKGSKVNPQAENSAVYQEDVVKLEAPIKAGGSVTYSSNGDGTINVYNKVPYRWADSQMSDYSNMDEVTKKAIEENIETVDVKPTDNKTIAELASKIEYSK
ncbi:MULTISPECIES: hypothetical protein [Staphylococcus]|uniref:hypothetical protein n=1 Tax=Staphylococcus TaxID=1279 RepID=UPI000D1BFD07|nr:MULTISPECIES: hypothetical protein [Staphylococcus]MBK3719022.1 hypothetical protein [Staphylococcus arlettae]MCD8815910.1 hypothetical protein [Staphylococcus arlettae]MCD8834094.1 hypothetical protein [Staphylococcus arlettae]MCD8840985.1 hypothetical protein [Staphylococcus arlettae]MCD8864321.1 hypothetical protein [Staphylococcus arlettae]